jgi:hypothetical protein
VSISPSRGAYTIPATGASSASSTPTDTAHVGNPWLNESVPSIGSITNVHSRRS